MKLSGKHTAYERSCRQIFVGQTIRAVIYGELRSLANEEGNDVNPEPGYKTTYPDIDTVDHSIYFKTDKKTICIFWDNTFICSGVQVKLVDFPDKTSYHVQRWDVSEEENWFDVIGLKIADFRIIWEESWTSNVEGINNVFRYYPQAFEITTESRKIIIVTASEFVIPDDNKLYSPMNNLLVTTNMDLARELKMIE